MEFQFIVIIVALIILVGILIIVYINLELKDKTFPKVMTNCPDYWEVNPDTGNCVIPSEDKPNANLGNLKNKGTPIYIYNLGTNNIQLSTVPSIGNGINKTTGTPYKINNYQVYAYNLNNLNNSVPAQYDIPVGYYYNTTKNEPTYILNEILNKGNEINFNDSSWINYDGHGSSVCQIKKWINKNNIVWDGIDSYNQCI